MTRVSIALTVIAVLILAAAAAALLGWRGAASDRAEVEATWQRLAAMQPTDPARFDPDSLADQPEPVQRLLRFLIAPGTTLYTVAEIEMGGDFSLGTADQHSYIPMTARQILASPHGFVWAVKFGGPLPMAGSDSATWTRFRALGLVPLVHAGGTSDHARSAFGRMVGEAVFWAPASVLPGPGVTWSAPDANTARVTLRQGQQEQVVDLHLAPDGRPEEIVFQRWTNANPDKAWRLQPFGGRLSDWRQVQGFTVPFKVTAANHWGEPDAFEFYRAQLTALRYVKPKATGRITRP